ncbi:DNA polymerase III subunit [Gordonia phage Sidious]|uniref:DNA polymerase III subunit n=1 Tax=Gordonia phage Sidious TaxID=2591118 RepID=A0A515MIB4_9CAUD|nr:DNA polymerase III subunit [Gordonia phage Sidious]QDM56406.1 DNA polymerase III subunit [Gordonia phage Sidious]
MITGTVAFVDTETTGLDRGDEIWEFAAIIRRPDGSESTVHIHIDHDFEYAATLDEKFRADHDGRFGAASDMHVYSRAGAASIIHAALAGTHIVGVNPAFDARMLDRLLDLAGLKPSWHYHLIDLAAMSLGVILRDGEGVELPWRSDDLAAEVMPMVDPDGEPLYARHTAMGDVLWARDWFDALCAIGGRGGVAQS